MHYTIGYATLTGQDKRDKAISDIRNFTGSYTFNVLATIAMDAIKYSHLSFPASFAGVQGYPVAALWDETRLELHHMCS